MKAATLALICLTAAGCAPDYTDYYFTGRVYNGAAGSRLIDYEISLEFLDRIEKGVVDADGRYVIGPMGPFTDYTIAIRADGFRSFLSHNIMKVNDETTFNNDPNDDDRHPDQSQYFDAYLFPTDIVSSAVTFRISASDTMDPISGTVRLRPVASSTLVDDAIEMPAGVGAQVWRNDEDLQFSSVTRDFTGSTVTFAEGDLIYGVTYLVTIYNVAGHAVTTGVFTAGQGGNQAFIVNPLTNTPLAVTFLSTQLGTPVASGELVMIFNQPIMLDPLATADTYLRSVEANFTISSPDDNMNGQLNVLEPFDPMMPAGSRGLSLTVSGSKLTLQWNPASALMTTDAADPIRSVTYGGLDGITLRPVAGMASDAVALDTLLGAASITVPVTP